MKPVKRVEIIIDALHAERVLAVLEAVGVSGYSIIESVKGKGGRGERSGDELTSVFSNTYILSACPPEIVENVAKELRPLLKRYGGACIISDAQWLSH